MGKQWYWQSTCRLSCWLLQWPGAVYYKTKLCYHCTWHDLEERLLLFLAWVRRWIEQHWCQHHNYLQQWSGYHNRNVTMSNALTFYCKTTGKTVVQKYLTKGHTQMEGDSVHSLTERRLKKKQVLLSCKKQDQVTPTVSNIWITVSLTTIPLLHTAQVSDQVTKQGIIRYLTLLHWRTIPMAVFSTRRHLMKSGPSSLRGRGPTAIPHHLYDTPLKIRNMNTSSSSR